MRYQIALRCYSTPSPHQNSEGNMRWVKMYHTQLSRRAAGKTSETQQTPTG